MVAATEAASAAAETEAATETEAEAAMILSPNAHPALATGRRKAKMSRTKQCKRTPQPSSAAGESEGIVPEPRRRYNPDLFARQCGEPRKATSTEERRLGDSLSRKRLQILYSNHHHSHRSPTLGVSKGQ